MARDVSATIKINDGFTSPLNNFASRLASAANKVGELSQKLGGVGRFKPPTPDFERFNSSLSQTNGLFSKMVGANVVGNVISRGIGAATGAVSGLIGELNQSSTAWQTFNSNMAMVGMNKAQIDSARADMQKFAQQTIYSSSDMATTYSQFAAVGVKDAGRLVKGFGGLAAAATDPQQAMKTLSQQSVQAAAKPTVQWQDFRLMLEQTPAGMAQVAKTMGVSLQDMIKNIQAGKVKTTDFFNAIKKTGTNAQFTKMATQYKTIGQAADGLKETLANALQPAFDKVSKVGINAISKLVDSIGNVDFNSMADKIAPVAQGIMNAITGLVKFVAGAFSNFWSGITNSGAVSAVSAAFGAISGAVNSLFNTLGKGGNNPFSIFKTLGNIAGGAITGLAKTIKAIADAIGKLDPTTLKMLGAAFVILKMGMKGLIFTAVIAGLNALSKLNPGTLNALATALIAFSVGLVAFKTAAKGVAAFNAVKDLFSMKKPQTPQTPKTPTAPTAPEAPAPQAGLAKKWLQLGAVFVMVGAGAALLGAGLWLMANAATNLAQSGGAAIAVFFGFFVAIGLLLVLVRALGPALIVGAAGFVVFAAGLLLIGVAIFIAAAGIALLATQLPTIAQYGLMASVAIIALGAAIAIFGALSIVGAIGIIALSAALIVAGVAMTIAAVGALLLGAAILVLGAGIIVAAVGVMLMAAFMPIIAATALTAGVGIMVLAAGALLLGVTAIAAGVGLIMLSVGLAIAGAAMIIATVGAFALGAGALFLAAGLTAVGAALMLVGAALMVAAAGFQMMVGVVSNAVNGIVNAVRNGFNNVVNSVRSGINNAVNTVRGMVGDFVSAGANLMRGLAQGIANGVGAVISKAKEVASSVASTVKGFFRIHSPSRLFADFGNYLDLGLAKGLNDGMKSPIDAANRMSSNVLDATSDLNNGIDLGINNRLPKTIGMPKLNTNSLDDLKGQTIDTSILNNLPMLQIAGLDNLPQLQVANSSAPAQPANSIAQAQTFNNVAATGTMQYAGPQAMPLDSSNVSLPQMNNPKLDTSGFNNVVKMASFNNPVLDTSGLNSLKPMQYAGPQALPLNASNVALPQLQAPTISNPVLDTSGLNNMPAVQFAGFGQLPQFSAPTVNAGNNAMDINANVNNDVPTNMPFSSETLQTSNVYNNTSTNNQGGNKHTDNSVNIAPGAIVINGTGNTEEDGETLLAKIEQYLKTKQAGGQGYGYN